MLYVYIYYVVYTRVPNTCTQIYYYTELRNTRFMSARGFFVARPNAPNVIREKKEATDRYVLGPV